MKPWTPEDTARLGTNVLNALQECATRWGCQYPMSFTLFACSGALMTMRAEVVDGTVHLITLVDFKPGVDFAYPAKLKGVDHAGNDIDLLAYGEDGPVEALKRQLFPASTDSESPSSPGA